MKTWDNHIYLQDAELSNQPKSNCPWNSAERNRDMRFTLAALASGILFTSSALPHQWSSLTLNDPIYCKPCCQGSNPLVVPVQLFLKKPVRSTSCVIRVSTILCNPICYPGKLQEVYNHEKARRNDIWAKLCKQLRKGVGCSLADPGSSMHFPFPSLFHCHCAGTAYRQQFFLYLRFNCFGSTWYTLCTRSQQGDFRNRRICLIHYLSAHICSLLTQRNKLYKDGNGLGCHGFEQLRGRNRNGYLFSCGWRFTCYRQFV